MFVTLVTVSATISIPVFWRGGHLIMGGGRLHVREVVAYGGLKNQAILNRWHLQGSKKTCPIVWDEKIFLLGKNLLNVTCPRHVIL